MCCNRLPRAAVQATVKGAEQHLELMARLFANGFKRMMKGILELVTTHQNRERVVRLRDTGCPSIRECGTLRWTAKHPLG